MLKIKNYERFQELYKEKNYALAYAICIKFTYLQTSPEYIQMEKNFQTSFSNAQKLIILNLQNKAKAQVSKYITVISKRQVLQLINNNKSNFRDFLLAYEGNDFKKCYEIMDKNKNIQLIEISILLNEHWTKLINRCLAYANNGDINSVKTNMGKLMLIESRADKIAEILKFTFQNKIESLLMDKEFISCEAVIYSYIDIFNIDTKLKKIMKIFEKQSSINLAITFKKQNLEKNSWRKSKLTIGLD